MWLKPHSTICIRLLGSYDMWQFAETDRSSVAQLRHPAQSSPGCPVSRYQDWISCRCTLRIPDVLDG